MLHSLIFLIKNITLVHRRKRILFKKIDKGDVETSLISKAWILSAYFTMKSKTWIFYKNSLSLNFFKVLFKIG